MRIAGSGQLPRGADLRAWHPNQRALIRVPRRSFSEVLCRGGDNSRIFFGGADYTQIFFALRTVCKSRSKFCSATPIVFRPTMRGVSPPRSNAPAKWRPGARRHAIVPARRQGAAIREDSRKIRQLQEKAGQVPRQAGAFGCCTGAALAPRRIVALTARRCCAAAALPLANDGCRDPQKPCFPATCGQRGSSASAETLCTSG